MEPLCKPSQLDFSFKPETDSSLDDILKGAGPVPNHRRSSQGDGLFNAEIPEEAASSSQGLAETSELDEYTQKFNAAMKNFTDLGDAEEFARQLEGIVGTSLKVLGEKRAFVTAIIAAMDDFLEPEDRG